MREKELPPRLRAIAAWVQNGARLADVGTDHALLPLFLLRQGKIVSAVATDIHEGPLQRARVNAMAQVAVNIRFLLCDGLEAVESGEVDTVVIAGLGGENMADILQRAPWVKTGVQLLLQPMSRSEALHRTLEALGLRVLRERLVEDSGRIYPVIESAGGERTAWREAEYYTGPFSMLEGDPLFPRYLDEQLRRLRPAVEGLRRSGREEELPRLCALERAVAELEEMRRKLCTQ